MINLQTQSFLKAGGLFAVLLAGIAAVLIASSASAQTTDARVRVLHGSPDAPAVDVFVDGNKAIPNLAFGSITDYVTLPAGAHNVKVFPAPSDGTGTPVIEADLTLEAGKDYTVAAANVLASIEPEVYVDNNAAPAAGTGHVRVIHLSPDAPAVDIFAEGAGVVVPNLAFKAASDYLPLNAATYNIQVRVAGTETVALNVGAVPVEAGKVYTVFAIGLANGTPALSAKLTTDAVYSATPAPTPAAAPSTGGAPGDTGSGLPIWALAGLALIVVGTGTTSLAVVRNRSER